VVSPADVGAGCGVDRAGRDQRYDADDEKLQQHRTPTAPIRAASPEAAGVYRAEDRTNDRCSARRRSCQSTSPEARPRAALTSSDDQDTGDRDPPPTGTRGQRRMSAGALVLPAHSARERAA
jgi:hypothetical protein